MSLLAKIFVVVVTVLSLVFLGVQATLFYHSTDWRDAYERLQGRMKLVVEEKQNEIVAVQSQVKDLDKTIEQLNSSVAQIKTVSKAAESALADKSAELQRQVSQYSNLETAHKTLASAAEEKDKQIKEYTGRISQLEDSLKTAQNEKELAEAQVARVTSIKTTLEKDLAEVRKDYTASKQKVLDMQLVMDELERQGVPIGTLVVNHKPVPPINGKVAGVRTDTQPALVLVTVGKDDKVEKGFAFTVYRGSTFVGKVVVEKVMADSAGCRVLFTAAGQTIKAGDDVATRLD